jgi:hypothetical protein
MTPLSSCGKRQKPGDTPQNALCNEFDEFQSWTQLKDNREHKEQDAMERILHQWYVLYLSMHILHLFISNLEVKSHAIRILISLESSIISDTLVLGPKEIDGCFWMLLFMESSLECCFLLVLTLQIMLVHDRYIYTDRKPFESLPNDYSCPVCAAPKRRFKPYELPVAKNANDVRVRKARKEELKKSDSALGSGLPVAIAFGIVGLIGTFVYLNSTL